MGLVDRRRRLCGQYREQAALEQASWGVDHRASLADRDTSEHPDGETAAAAASDKVIIQVSGRAPEI
jgi:hypothetical protein